MGDWEIVNFNPELKNINKINIDEIFLSNEKEVILCVGQVQSGKTKRICEIIKSSINFNYDYVIVLGGTNNILLDQTYSRLYDYFINDIKTKDNNSILQNINNFNIDENNKKTIIFTILKNMNQINKWYEESNNKNLKNKKILIIDDESDFGSINNKKDGYSEVYNTINKLFNRLPDYNCKLFQITATPYANILSNSSNDLKSKKIICWKPNSGYTGWDFFNNRKEKFYKKINFSKDENEDLRNAIIESIKYHFIACLNLYRINKNEKSDLLINVFLEKDKHLQISEMVDETIQKIDSNKDLFFDLNYLSEFINKIDYLNFLPIYLKETEIIILNSENENITNSLKKYKIIIGGSMVSRGNTYENLMVELFLNSPNDLIQVDTLLQRCRWFGYRNSNPKKIEYMKILMSEKIYDALIECKDYINLFKEGSYNINSIYTRLKEIDLKTKITKVTSNAKSR